jgi:hypothetical protein
MRSEVARWLAVVILAPLLALGTFGGFRVYAHAHDGHGLHFHAARTNAGAVSAAATHRASHQHGACAIDAPARTCEDSGGCGHTAGHRSAAADPGASTPGEGILIVLPDHEQMLARGIALNGPTSPVAALVLAAFVVPSWPVLDRHIGSPGGAAASPNPHALHATDRLVRTSCALLL